MNGNLYLMLPTMGIRSLLCEQQRQHLVRRRFVAWPRCNGSPRRPGLAIMRGDQRNRYAPQALAGPLVPEPPGT